MNQNTNEVEFNIVNIEILKYDCNNEIQTFEGLDGVVYCIRVNEDDLKYEMIVGVSDNLESRPDYLEGKSFKTYSSLILGLKEILTHYKTINLSVPKREIETYNLNSENVEEIAKLIASKLQPIIRVKSTETSQQDPNGESIITFGNTESISASATEGSIISKLPKDALENVKGFLQEKRESLFFIASNTYDHEYLKVSMYKDGFKIESLRRLPNTYRILPENMKQADSKVYPLFFRTKKTLVKYLITYSYMKPDEAEEYEQENGQYPTTECMINYLGNNLDAKRTDKNALKELYDDFVDMIEDGFRIL